jgi:hypothetical protein
MFMEEVVELEEVCVELPVVETAEDELRAITAKKMNKASAIIRVEIVPRNCIDFRELGVFRNDCQGYSLLDALIKIRTFIPFV